MEHAKSSVRGTHDHGYAMLNAYRYMLEVANPGSKTTLSLNENGRFKYNIMTSNIAESVNVMFDVGREFPIVTLCISKYVNAGNKLLAHQIANYKFSVTGHGDVATVDLQRRTCTCRFFDLDKIPSPHAMEALRSQYSADFANQIYEYTSPYYSVEKYIITYCEQIHPVPPKDSWIVPLDTIEREIPPPYVDPRKPGRRRYKRRRGVGSYLMEGGLVTECMGSFDPPPFKKEW
ncbi:uncharacterized protein LOC125833197 [Solanum verrucosum]|uniref:uncharacterized protein LOC125833197 n=1 Tax=Solanum verrucosum TaxID=315347 RepID=UPI0020D0234A|nr:uncharacterized protein LOC125833197 [Solanum verrucosum]